MIPDATETATTGSGNAQYGCWIGFQDLGAEGVRTQAIWQLLLMVSIFSLRDCLCWQGFVWIDGSSVEFVDFAPGEPNGVDDANGGAGEDAVELDFRERLSRFVRSQAMYSTTLRRVIDPLLTDCL